MNNPDSLPLSYKAFGEGALLVEWPAQINQNTLFDILRLQSAVESKLGDALVETVNAYHSLTIIFNPETLSFEGAVKKVQSLYPERPPLEKLPRNLWAVPVCYDMEYGIDLEEVAHLHKLTVDEVVALHCQPEYTIYFTGFLPGFLYLGGLPESIHTPRKPSPRLRVKKGAVAIAGGQTGVYPSDSPGGWNIIGNSPLPFFDPVRQPPCFARAGDLLRFYPVSKEGHKEILEKVALGTFTIEPQPR
ncbi:MAG TPA: 5-oxoprolinase subunit PxpB [Cyclobacteriaceae bacterium]|nr:5-oxoprolinase subunit PxpB [Cyclobacteriaceae bacterium]